LNSVTVSLAATTHRKRGNIF